MKHGAFILARYSTDRQEQDSIEVQVEKCSGWCQKNGIPILDIFPDYAVSGMKTSRPQYDRMMQQLQAGLADTVVIYDQSRMFRKMTAWFEFRDTLEDLGVRVVSVTQPMIGGDLKDPTNFLTEGSMALFNQMWVLQTRQKTIEKLRFMARNGQHTGGIPPLGYRAENGRLVIDPAEAAVVRRIFTMYADGSSYRQIIEALNADGIKTKRGKPFGNNSLHDLLKNKKYIGTVTYGKTVKKSNGTRNSHICHVDMMELEDCCPAIVDRDIFDIVQKKMLANRHSPGRPPVNDTFHLRGKVFCGECGSAMCVVYSGPEKIYAYYYCSGKKRKHLCGSKRVRANPLEAAIAQGIRERLGTPQDRSALIEILRQQRDMTQGGAGSIILSLTAVRKAVIAKLENATEAVLQGLASPTLLDRIRQLENEKAGLDYQIEELHKNVSSCSVSDEDLDAMLDTIEDAVKDSDAALLSIVYRVEVWPQEIKVWTILDCAADNGKRISLKKEELPEPNGSGSCVEMMVTRRGFEPRTHCLKGSCSAN